MRSKIINGTGGIITEEASIDYLDQDFKVSEFNTITNSVTNDF